MTESLEPEWCLVATVLPYPYRGDKAAHRSHGIFPAGAKLYIVGGFAGMANETVAAVGYPHGRRPPVVACLPHYLLGGWRVRLVYRPVILRKIHEGFADWPVVCHRFLNRGETSVTSPEYRDHLQTWADRFQAQSAEVNP